MKHITQTIGHALEAWVPTLLLGGGLITLIVLVVSVNVPVWRMMSAFAALCMLSLWWMLRRQERILREMRQLLGCFREETMTRRSTMRFIFDELLDDSDVLRAQVIRIRHLLQTSLNVASGFLELLSQELRTMDQAPADGYLREVRKAMAQSVDLVDQLGRKRPAIDQNRPAEGSEKSSTVSARNRL